MEARPATAAPPGAAQAAQSWRLLAAIGASTAAAHIGNNFSTYLIGGLMDRFGFTPVQMGIWTMVETLSYAAAMFLVAPRVASLSPRALLTVSGVLVVGAQGASALQASLAPLLAGRLACGLGFGLANTALNLAAGRTAHPARAISIGIACQTALYVLINILLPRAGQRFGVAGEFLALAALSAAFTTAAFWLPAAPLAATRPPPRPPGGPAGAGAGAGRPAAAAAAGAGLGAVDKAPGRAVSPAGRGGWRAR